MSLRRLDLFFLMGIFFIGRGIQGQLTVPPSTAAILGNDVLLTCTSSEDSVFTWSYATEAQPLYTGSTRATSLPRYDHIFLQGGTDAQTSILNISAIEREDEGDYRCSTTSQTTDPPITTVTIEVAHTFSLDVADTLVNGNMYDATCEAQNGRPEVTITWMLDDSGSSCVGTPVETDLPADPPDPYLSGKRSVCTFQALSENNGKTLRCIISGHQVEGLNGEETATLNILSAPADSGIIIVGFQFQDPNLNVSCDINTEADPVLPNPMMMNYYITSNGTLIHQSDEGVNFRVVAEPSFATEFLCVAGNYLGNTTSPVATYDPSRTTTPLTVTTEGTTSEPRSEEPSASSCICNGLSSGASAGIAILAILLAGSIIINVIQFILWRRHSTDEDGSQKVTSSDVRGGSNEANDNVAYEMIQSGDRAYTALKLSSSGTSRSATIDPENVTFFTRLGSIGRGDFGAVWKGELRSNQGQAAVAIRQIPDNVSKSTNALQSVKVLCELSDQPNVVKCLGFCQEQSSIIYEFLFGGTLLTHLQMTGVQSQPTYSNLKPNRVRIDEGSLLNFAWQIATGMQFLASKKIIHGTLCAHNVLLGDRKQCKLSDYGLASSLFSNRGKPTRWSSPETMVTGDQSKEGDIWSFGIVLWEIVTLGARPYPNMTFDTVQKEVSNGYKMPRPRHCGQELYTIMSRCWESEGRNRIRFDEILKTLERILEKTHDYLSLSDLDKDLYASPLDV